MADLGTPPLAPRVLLGRVLLALGPLLVLLAWILAGRWGTAGAEARAWVGLVSALALAAFLPVPAANQTPLHTTRPAARLATSLRWWGWMTVAGLLATT
ncbi:MAG: hypothetical protein HOP14_14375 [Acidobacteria bacterium]|nr:hypothetical protein [Acidobacteriota bacterium]